MGIEEILGAQREEILRIAATHGVIRIRVFGEILRGDADDVDFLIETGAETTPWFPGGLVADLRDLLGKHVHVYEECALGPRMKPVVLAEAIPI